MAEVYPVNRPTFVATFLFAALLAAPASAEDEGLLGKIGRGLGLIRDPSGPASMTLAALRENPEAFRGVRVTLTLQMHERTQFWNPFFTRFTPDSYVNFSAWSDDQRLWIRSEFEKDFALFFVERQSEALPVLLAAAPYTRLRVTAVVRDMFRGLPWIEVLKATPLSDKVSEGTLLHAARARRWMEAGKWSLATNEFERAITDGLPTEARVALMKDLGTCHFARGDRASARNVLAAAGELDPNDRQISEALEGLLREGGAATVRKEAVEAPAKEPTPEPAPTPAPAPAPAQPETKGG